MHRSIYERGRLKKHDRKSRQTFVLFTLVKMREEWATCLSPYYKLSLGSNLGARQRHELGDVTVFRPFFSKGGKIITQFSQILRGHRTSCGAQGLF